MKKTKLLFLALLGTLSANAQAPANGYYLIKNVGTDMYITSTDSYGERTGETTADLTALKLVQKNAIDDSGIIYLKQENQGEVNLIAQGANTNYIWGWPLHVWDQEDTDWEGNKIYRAYIKRKGVTVYLSADENNELTTEKNSTISNANTWTIVPVTEWAVKPNLTVNGVNYRGYCVDFPYTPAEHINAYIVSSVDEERGVAIYSSALDGKGNYVPAGTPVILANLKDVEEPASEFVEAVNDNKLTIVNQEPQQTPGSVADGNAVAPVVTSDGNELNGVYFCNTTEGKHFNAVKNEDDMRVLGQTAAGQLIFTKSDAEYLPANSVFVRVSKSGPECLYVSDGTDEKATCLVGDITGPEGTPDGVVDVQDVASLVRMILKKIPEKYTADLTNNGIINVEDYAKMVRIILKNNQ